MIQIRIYWEIQDFMDKSLKTKVNFKAKESIKFNLLVK